MSDTKSNNTNSHDSNEKSHVLARRFSDSMPVPPQVDVDRLLTRVQETHGANESAGQETAGQVSQTKTRSRQPGLDLVIRLATLASLAGIIVMLAFALSKPAQGQPFNFDDVKKSIDRIKSVTYTEIRTEPRYRAAIRYARDSKMADDKYTNGLMDPEYTEVMILGKSLKRYRHLKHPDDYYVDDLETGVSISVDVKKKTYTVHSEHKTINLNGKVLKTQKPKPAPEVDFYKRIKEIPVDEMTPIGEAYIDGKKALGFRRVEKQNLETWTRTWWINAETRLPVREETEFRSKNPMIGENDWVRTNFKFDEPLDRDLFDTSPDGFKPTEPQSVLGIDPYGEPSDKQK